MLRATPRALELTDWFSFLLSPVTLPTKPSHDYFIDFEFTDVYNFVLEFDRPVEITNAGDFSHKIDDDFFALESRISQDTERSWRVHVNFAVKERHIPMDKMEQLMDVVKALDALNRFKLQFSPR